jgi:hypothetical protein
VAWRAALTVIFFSSFGYIPDILYWKEMGCLAINTAVMNLTGYPFVLEFYHYTYFYSSLKRSRMY